MPHYLFVYTKPVQRVVKNKKHLRWSLITHHFGALSYRHAVKQAQEILETTRIDFVGGYAIGSAKCLLVEGSNATLMTAIRSKPLGL